MSLDKFLVRKALARGVVLKHGTDVPVAIRIRNKAGLAVTSVTVTTGTNLVLIDSAATTTVTFATDTTLAKVASRINASATWECKILDALSTQLSTSTLLDGAITVGLDGRGNAVYDVLQDTSTALEIGACISPFRDFDAPTGHRVVIKNIKYGVNMGTAAVDSAQLYKRLGGVETKVFGELSVDTTETTTLDFLSSPDGFVGEENAEYYFRVKDAATLADATSNYVRIIGYLE